MNSNELSLRDLISRNRSFIMGIAIIIIAIYHVPNHTTLPVLGFLQNIGYGGTDIFILLSGFGAYHSLSRDDDAYSFFKRRLFRILPAYIPFILVWMVVHKILFKLYFTEICGNLTMLGWWNGDENQLNWYVDCIIVFYLLAPYIYKSITTAKRQLLCVILLIVLALLIGVAFMHGQLTIAISRLPIFIMGFAFAGIKNKFTEGRISVIIWNLFMIPGFAGMYILMNQSTFDLWHYGLYWYPFILITPGLVIDFSFLSDALSKTTPGSCIKKGISEIGNASFEIFLIHLFVFENLMYFVQLGWFGWLMLGIASFILGYLYYRLVKGFQKRLPSA